LRTALLVEDDAASSQPLAQILTARGFKTSVADSLSAARSAIERGPEPDLVFLDMGLPDGDGMELLLELQCRPGQRAVVVLTGQRDLERAVLAMRHGAVDYVIKPMRADVLDATLTRVGRVLDDAEEKQDLRRRLADLGSFEGLIGRSPAMRRVYGLVERGAPSRVPVFIEGESGTGKELLARAVHRVSPRRSRPFVAVNCGALPANLVESELFGHERGAFTGATGRRDGVFQQADGGTLFLDELGEMPLDLQVRLLRVLETGTVRRVGGNQDQTVDVRIVSATNRDPTRAVADGVLREDLYYRLYVFPVALPPLRQRAGDVPLLARHFIEAAARDEGANPVAIEPEALRTLEAHSWPGNVRELKNVMARAFLLANGRAVTTAELPLLAAGPAAAQPGLAPPPGGDALMLPLGTTLEQADRRIVEWYLEYFEGHREKTARALGVTPKTLYNKCKAWGVAPPTARDRGKRGEGE
jgi:two-component system response regulator AtoC